MTRVRINDANAAAADGGDRDTDENKLVGRSAMMSRTARNGAESLKDDGARDGDGNPIRGRKRWMAHSTRESRRAFRGES